MPSMEAVIDAAEFVVSELESYNEVAYAEVGGVARDTRDVVVRRGRSNSATPVESEGVWWRVFTDGVASHRHTNTLEESHLSDLVERTVRSGQLLKQDDPASYDRGSVHRATHPGWGAGARLDELDPDEVADELAGALEDAAAACDTELSRAKVTYRDAHEESVFITTTGTALQTTTERVWTSSVLTSESVKVGDDAGGTNGCRFLDGVPRRLSELTDRLDRLAGTEPARVDDGRREVALSPTAAASLFHELSHYLEMDMVYFGSSPFDVGDRLGPDGLTIEDIVRPGSFAARPYDAEGRPTTPTTLVEDGVVANRLHDTATAVDEGGHPAGNVVPPIGHEDPPRIHARHLDVAPGTASLASIREEADLYVERFGTPRFGNEATHTKRTSAMPPSTLYAKQIADHTPSDFDDEPEDQRLELPVEVGYTLDGDVPDRRLEDVRLTLPLADVTEITALSAVRETAAGTCTKHHSTLPWAATAPAVSLPATVHASG